MAGRSGPPDPFGKRALFWLPVDQPDAGPRPSRRQVEAGQSSEVAGKRALYSSATGDRGLTGTVPPRPVGSDPGEGVTDGGVRGHRVTGRFAVACSSCGETTAIGILDLVTLHIPFSAFVPLRAFDHWMRCPACHRRTWAGVSLVR